MDLEHEAIKRIQAASEMSLKIFQKPLVMTFSGGKDSSACLDLTIKSEVPFSVRYNHTSVDAPETVYFIRDTFNWLENNIDMRGGVHSVHLSQG